MSKARDFVESFTVDSKKVQKLKDDFSKWEKAMSAHGDRHNALSRRRYKLEDRALKLTGQSSWMDVQTDTEDLKFLWSLKDINIGDYMS